MKRNLSLLLVFVLILGLCACGGGKGTAGAAAEASASNETVSLSAEPSEPANAPEESAAEAPEQSVMEEEADDDFLPLCEETGSLQIWLPTNPVAGAFLEDGLNSHVMYQEAEKLTNVVIDWLSPNVFAADENFQLMIASNDLPDIIYEFCTRYNGGAAGLDDELVVDINWVLRM